MSESAMIAAIRFGYGMPLPDGAPQDAGALLARLAGPDRAAEVWPGYGLGSVLPLQAEGAKLRRLRKNAEEFRAEYRAAVNAVDRQFHRARQVMLARALGASDGFRERLVVFWADHFTTVAKRRENRGLVPAMIEDAIRPHLTGRFADLLQAAVLHPSMLLYLDQYLSVGPNAPGAAKPGRGGLNENLGRELIELHTLGVAGGYTQADVREMAELLTGLIYSPKRGQAYNARRAEPGAETILGQIYDGPGIEPILRALQDLARRPETARHLATKLATHFVADAPDPGLVAAMEAAYLASDGDLLAVYRALLTHPAAWNPALTKARQPYDFVVAALRALDLGPVRIGQMNPREMDARILKPLHAMGQPLFEAPGPDGWPEDAEVWISPQGLAARIQWAMDAPQRLRKPLPDPAALATRALGSRASAALLRAAQRAENLREGVGLVLASAEFNRR